MYISALSENSRAAYHLIPLFYRLSLLFCKESPVAHFVFSIFCFWLILLPTFKKIFQTFLVLVPQNIGGFFLYGPCFRLFRRLGDGS